MRTVSDLFADQIEFANVIIINKIDLVDQATRDRVMSYVKALNPKAKIIEAERAKVDVKEIINTGSFDIEEAHFAAGWMQSVHDMDIIDVNGKKKLAPKPETLECVAVHTKLLMCSILTVTAQIWHQQLRLPCS